MYTLIVNFFQIAKLIRFSLLMLVIGLAVLWVDQWLEALRYLSVSIFAEFQPNAHWQSLFLGIATSIASLSTWYAARVMFMLRIEHIPATYDDCYPRFKKHLPRLLGLLMHILVMIALFKANKSTYTTIVTYAFVYQLIAAILYLNFVIFRRKLLPKRMRKIIVGKHKDLKSLPAITFKLIWLSLFISFVVMLMVTINPYLIAWSGTAAIVLLSVSLMIPMGSLLTYLSCAYQFPVFILIFLWLVTVSYFNDNHLVRLHAQMSSKSITKSIDKGSSQLSDFDTYLDNWIARNKQDVETLPLIIVSAEGGGIRAAYWTALVLASLHDANAKFSQHVFAISGVSGGSLGGAAYAALLKQKQRFGFASDFSSRVNKLLDDDFLSPTVATMLFPDLLQRFIPFAWFNDRAITLEKSWEKTWADEFVDSDNFFQQSFFELYADEQDNIPLLFLNSTVVETGRRMLISPIAYGRSNEFATIFNQTLNANPIVGKQIPLSTAVHLSARFTYVSPAGRLHCPPADKLGCGAPKKLEWIRVVDGGYFENSATVTASEILTKVAAYNKQDKCQPSACIQPIILHISNEPESNKEKYQANKHVLLNEVLSPLRALLNARPARGYQARAVLASENTDSFYHVSLKKDENISLPLGWMLGEAAIKVMHQQIQDKQLSSCMQDSSHSEQLCELLRKL